MLYVFEPMRPLTVSDVPGLLRQLEKLDAPMMFRGQAKHWPLLPSIARLRRQIAGYSNWRVFQEDLVERFAKYASPLIQPQPRDSEEWLVHAQHHGVPTRLLDWTTNPLKALFWAVEAQRQQRADGTVWAFAPRYWRDDVLRPTVLADDELTPYFPKQVNPRTIAQEGCFVAFPLPENKKRIQPMVSGGDYAKSISELVKLNVPASAKRGLRIELRVLGITHRSLFPDLDGVAQSINSELREA
jgi:hypothetical protein